MTPGRIAGLLAGLALFGVVVFIAANTEFTTTEVPLPLRGEARRNPFYAAERLTRTLGGRPAWAHTLGELDRDAAVVVSGLHWTLIPSRREAIERWVDAGGRLVVDSQILGFDAFESWSGITLEFPEEDEDDSRLAEQIEERRREDRPPCRAVTSSTGGERFRLCGFRYSWLTSRSEPAWSLSDDRGLQAVRVSVGRGSVTVVNGTPFTYRNLLEGGHARLFVAVTQLRRGDAVRFISENESPSLLSLIWTHGAPVVVLLGAWVAAALWRGGVRFGPPAPPPGLARRSLGEQIRGTGRFTLRSGGGDALHAATVRALEEAAGRRVPGLRAMGRQQRAEAIAAVTNTDPTALVSAMTPGDVRRPADLRHAIALLEAIRRQLLHGSTGEIHGRD